ncbi:OVARIAN TUMOR DOMAIN-containing deubiquitinating enzyme 11-like [Miscanthus floridulus]|uniref:OVARIAN TUMOR DOMAIN-containing deubiquitinating enzyme 11-like n=1 Tax=Miscanthus floridulus TaxID=154761 RepID=UPI0034581152
MTEQQERVSKSSSSSISSSTQESEEELTIGTLITEATNTTNSAKNLGRRLSHLDSIPHTPRVNGKIPDFNNATIDHESLLERLGTYGLAEYQIEGDGNCQFRALADQIFRNPDYHKHVRKAVVKQLKEFRKHYEGYVPMEYKVYLKKMRRSGEWGDHVTLQAAADRFAAKICLLTSFRDTCLVEIVPRDATPTRELWLSFWCEVHYNSLYAVEDLPTRKTKKKHWLF